MLYRPKAEDPNHLNWQDVNLSAPLHARGSTISDTKPPLNIYKLEDSGYPI